MHFWLAYGCSGGALLLLVALSIVDLRVRLLPNEMVAGVALLGLIFHVATKFAFVTPLSVAVGGLAGFGLLYAIRAVASRLYRDDALGLGDVKLIGAGGLWLGGDGIMLALAAGALFALLHGFAGAAWTAWRTGGKLNLATLKVPAGPGFAAGLACGGLIEFWPLWRR